MHRRRHFNAPVDIIGNTSEHASIKTSNTRPSFPSLYTSVNTSIDTNLHTDLLNMATTGDHIDPRARKRIRLTEDEPPREGPSRSTAAFPVPAMRRLVLLNRATYTQTDLPTASEPFRMITSLCCNMDVLLNMVRFLTPRSLVYLYSISAPFHYMMDSHFTAFILSCVHGFSAGAERYFPWRCYRELCIDDPGLRRSATRQKNCDFKDRFTGVRRASDAQNTQTEVSDSFASAPITAVPSLRWLKMVTFREIVAQEIVAWLAVKGHRTPVKPTIDAIKVRLQSFP